MEKNIDSIGIFANRIEMIRKENENEREREIGNIEQGAEKM